MSKALPTYDEIQAENARLTAQVAAADAMRGRVAYATGIASDGTWKVLTEALKAYDAATAPADADPMNAMNTHSERIEQPVPLDPFRREWIRETEGILAKHEQRLDALSARIDVSDKRSEILREDVDVIKRKQQAFSLADDTTIVEIEHRLLALEAARQPQPTPSAPVVVTDEVLEAARRAGRKQSRTEGLMFIVHDTALRACIEAAFAARDREVKDEAT